MKYLSFTPLLLLLLSTSCGSKKDNEKVITKEPLEFAELDFTKSYAINDKEFGTKTTVTVKNNQRIMVTNGLPNHSTGEFPNPGNPNSIKAQDLKYSFTTKPKFSGESKWSREPGVAVNGIKFEPETAERFVCETGEVYKIEAIQDLVNLGLDFNLAHVQPTGAYHYHGVPKELIKKLDKGEDIILVGYAKDGFPIYYSKSGKYKPSYVLSEDLRTGDACSYKSPTSSMEKELNNTRPDGIFVSDWTYVEGEGQLDECNGIEINGSYRYFITDEYPYVSRCLKGEFKEEHPDGPPQVLTVIVVLLLHITTKSKIFITTKHSFLKEWVFFISIFLIISVSCLLEKVLVYWKKSYILFCFIFYLSNFELVVSCKRD